MLEEIAITDIKIGNYNVDLFVCSDGRLGISVNRTDLVQTEMEVLDIFVPTSLDRHEVSIC